jgi:protein Tex
MDHAEPIARQLALKPSQVTAAIELLDAGNTLPFVARYRKEATAGLDEEQLRQIAESLARLRNLDERRQTILAGIESQEKLTPALRQQILAASTLTALEDLYLPYKPKRRTRATMARDKGLQPLADLILAQGRGGRKPEELAQAFLSGSVTSPADALAGARDIVAEVISDHPDVRGRLREKAMRWSLFRCQKIESSADPRRLYELYYAYEMRVDRLRPHQVLAINRGEAEKVLRVQVSVADRDWQEAIAAVFRPQRHSLMAGELEQAAHDAAQRLLLPAIERDVRRALTAEAEAHAIAVFATNLRGLLSQPPMAGHTVLGIDPGFRTGCKVAVVDTTGKVLDSATIYPHEPQKRREEALRTLARLVNAHRASLIAIGNGTASRETEQLAAALINDRSGDPAAGAELHYLMVNEAGASVYSASSLARAELPDLDVTIRGAVSIARRVQDPLAELVKIDPQSIGVGLYQHDVNQNALAAALDGVVESVVNNVGVDANTASAALLRYVAGIGPKLAERIVAYRDENGPFASRKAILKVPGLGPKAFEQAAGFLRIRDGDNPLDAGAIHPESYPVAEAIVRQAGVSLQAPPAEREAALKHWRRQRPLAELAAALGTGALTLADILEQLVRPGRDPRADLPPPILRHDVLSMDDLRPGMRLQGTVRNVVDFGAFIDIGVKQDGLLHRSQLPRGAAVTVGDVLEVAVLNVEPERGRISLTWASAH